MRRRRLLLSLTLIFGFIALLCGAAAVLVKREPSFYTQATIAPGTYRDEKTRQALDQYANIQFGISQYCVVTFTAEQINSFFQSEDYEQFGGDENLPENFHGLRVKFEEGRLRVGVRYGEGLWSTILSIEVRLWLIPDQTNTLALEVVSLHAGALPISSSTLLDYISEIFRKQNCEVTWYRNDGHPVAVIKIMADKTIPTALLEKLQLTDNNFVLVARSTDPAFANDPKPSKSP